MSWVGDLSWSGSRDTDECRRCGWDKYEHVNCGELCPDEMSRESLFYKDKKVGEVTRQQDRMMILLERIAEKLGVEVPK